MQVMLINQYFLSSVIFMTENADYIERKATAETDDTFMA